MKLKTYIDETIEFRPFLYQMVSQLIFIRYRRTVFGYLWTLLNPLLMMSVTALVFSSIYNIDLKTFAIYMFSGTIGFNFFSNSVSQSAQSFIGNESLLLKVYIPRFMFPLSNVLFVSIDNVLMMLALSLIILVIGGKLSLALFFLPFAYLIIFMFSLGISLIASIMSVYFRDLPHLLVITFQALLFLSPVFIKPTELSSRINILFKYNPLTYYIDLFRSPIYENSFPPLSSILISIILSIVSLFIGFKIFNKYQGNIALRL